MTEAAGGMAFAQAIPDRVVGSQALVVPVCGWLTGEAVGSERVLVEIDGEPGEALRLDEPVPPRLFGREDLAATPHRGFAGDLRLPARAAGHEHAIKLTRMTESRDCWQVSIHTVRRAEMDVADIQSRGLSPRVAVCMAVYNPNPRAFAEQVRTIAAQALDDWICIISDDGSDDDRAAIIRDTVADDARFFYFRNDRNLGFYHNFEAALARVPAEVEYVALSDQDDRWYPDKLRSLLDALDDGTWLAYSDMRLVTRDGGELASSYWGYRINNYRDLRLMLVANTVTGAACMMRRRLLDVLLPFPPRVGDAFHDHWIACAALAAGRIAYVDRPLYDYVQHDDAVIGHCGFDSSMRSVRRRDRDGPIRRISRLTPAWWRSLGARFMGAGQAVYWHECRRIETLCQNLLARGVALPESRDALRTYGRGLRSAWRLLSLNLRTRTSARLTNNAERRLAHGYLVHGMLRLRHRSN